MPKYPSLFTRGLAVLAATTVLAAAPATAQVQSSDQKKCITGLNKAGAKVASTQGKEGLSCVKNAGKGSETDATACLTADPKGKVAKTVTKVGDTFTKSCGSLPDFGPTDASTVSNGAKDETVGIATDLFGADVTGAMILSSNDKDAAKCQASVIQATQKLADQIVKDFGSCKSSGLKDDSIDSAAALDTCITTVNSDLKGKLAKAQDKIESTIAKKCEGIDMNAVLPGACEGFTQIHNCIAARARCRACSALSVMDGLGDVCDRFDDTLPANASCGTPVITTSRVSLPSSAEPAESPGTLGVVVTNPKLLTQFGPGGPDMNRADYVRMRLSGPDVAPDAVLILVPGFGAGVNIFRVLAEDLLPKILAEKGIRLEIWSFSRRDDLLEDREGAVLAYNLSDASIAQDWYYGAELGLTLGSELVSGPNRRAVFYNSSSDIPFLANYTTQVFTLDIDAVVDAALAVTPNVFLGGHSAGTGFTARYAATDLNLSGIGPADPAYAKLRGLVLLEGGGGSTSGSPLSADSIDRIIAKADGGLFGAVRDNAPRCVDGTTPCTIATEAAACIGQIPPKCTLPTTAYTSIGGLQPQLYAAGEVGGVQLMTDPDYGQIILQVDQGAPGNNAIAQVPALGVLSPPLIPASTVEGLFGIFLDDDDTGALISLALATSLGERGAKKNDLVTWKDIDEGVTDPVKRPNNGPKPTSLPAGQWGQEVEVSRISRHALGFVAGGENSSDWYYAGSGQSTTSVSGICSMGTCIAGAAGACVTNSDCSQSVGLDSSALSATRPDIANLTQAGSINIPVISFGGSNGLTPVGASFLGFGQSIGTCTAPSCDGTPRVVDAALPNPAFPTFGDVNGGFEVYISEGYAHVDVVSAEDTPENEIPEQLADFLERNLVP